VAPGPLRGTFEKLSGRDHFYLSNGKHFIRQKGKHHNVQVVALDAVSFFTLPITGNKNTVPIIQFNFPLLSFRAQWEMRWAENGCTTRVRMLGFSDGGLPPVGGMLLWCLSRNKIAHSFHACAHINSRVSVRGLETKLVVPGPTLEATAETVKIAIQRNTIDDYN